MTPRQYARARKRLDLSHAEMGERLGVSEITSWRYERGATSIPGPVEKLVAIFLKEKPA